VHRITNSKLEQLVVTDSIPLRDEAQALKESGKIKVLSVAGLLGAAILSIHMETSVSSLFS
ncbi:MAG TPA: phosphoribosylpyrophosphate synthetase, partial [Acidobacteriaceae bacterium]|nr:phosphoribosylpyrophosphate synthetase [Acidobacteriaceae bacterium]